MISTAALALAEVLLILLVAIGLALHELRVLRDEERRDEETRHARAGKSEDESERVGSEDGN